MNVPGYEAYRVQRRTESKTHQEANVVLVDRGRDEVFVGQALHDDVRRFAKRPFDPDVDVPTIEGSLTEAYGMPVKIRVEDRPRGALKPITVSIRHVESAIVTIPGFVSEDGSTLLVGEFHPLSVEAQAVRKRLIAERPGLRAASSKFYVSEFIDFQCERCRVRAPEVKAVVVESGGAVEVRLFPLTRVHDWAFAAAEQAAALGNVDPALYAKFEEAVFARASTMSADAARRPRFGRRRGGRREGGIPEGAVERAGARAGRPRPSTRNPARHYRNAGLLPRGQLRFRQRRTSSRRTSARKCRLRPARPASSESFRDEPSPSRGRRRLRGSPSLCVGLPKGRNRLAVGRGSFRRSGFRGRRRAPRRRGGRRGAHTPARRSPRPRHLARPRRARLGAPLAAVRRGEDAELDPPGLRGILGGPRELLSGPLADPLDHGRDRRRPRRPPRARLPGERSEDRREVARSRGSRARCRRCGISRRRRAGKSASSGGGPPIPPRRSTASSSPTARARFSSATFRAPASRTRRPSPPGSSRSSSATASSPTRTWRAS